MRSNRLTPARIAAVLLGLAAVIVGIILATSKPPWAILQKIGTPKSTADFMRIYEWWAGAMNVFFLLLLAATARWWLRPAAVPSRRWLPDIGTPRWFWPLVLVAMALTAFWGFQRLPFSLWDDEETSLRRAILGEYRPNADGTLKLREAGWDDTLWNYRKPTNHQLQSLLSKAFLESWRAVARPQGLQFSESVLRFPGYLAGILSIGALAFLLKHLGFPRAGVAAAFLLAIHPWHIRYAAEARGYIFTLLFLPLAIYCLLQAIENGRWRWWLAFAATEFALLYAYPGCLYLVVVINLCGLAWLGMRHQAIAPPQVWRLFAVSMAAGMVYLQLMLPCVPQLAAYLATGPAGGQLTARWHRNMGSHMLCGIPWNNSDAPEAGHPELQWIAQAHPTVFGAAAVAVIFCLILGCLRLAARKPAGPLLAACFLLPALLVYWVARGNGNYLYEWYLIFALPGLVAFTALGTDAIASLTQKWHRFAPPAALVLALALAAWATHTPRRWFLTHSLQPIRESVELTRPSFDPADPRQRKIITVAIGSPARVYDPHTRGASDVENFLAAMREADATGKILYANYGNGWASAVDTPRSHQMIEDDRLFEKIATLTGFDPTLTRFIRRYKPGAIAGYPVPK